VESGSFAMKAFYHVVTRNECLRTLCSSFPFLTGRMCVHMFIFSAIVLAYSILLNTRQKSRYAETSNVNLMLNRVI
jgi:hypothetical protein